MASWGRAKLCLDVLSISAQHLLSPQVLRLRWFSSPHTRAIETVRHKAPLLGQKVLFHLQDWVQLPQQNGWFLSPMAPTQASLQVTRTPLSSGVPARTLTAQACPPPSPVFWHTTICVCCVHTSAHRRICTGVCKEASAGGGVLFPTSVPWDRSVTGLDSTGSQ